MAAHSPSPLLSSLLALQWFLEVYPLLPPDQRPLEFVQQAGEVVYLPGGWWHCVLNLEHNVAVTHNFVSAANLERVVRFMAGGEAAFYAQPAAFFGGEGSGSGANCFGQGSGCAAQAPEAEQERPAGSEWRVSASSEACTGCDLLPQLPRVDVTIQPAAAPAAGVEPGSGSSSRSSNASDEGGSDAPPPVHPLAACREGGGYGATRQLGWWLHALWQQQPVLQQQLLTVCERWLGGGEWQRLLHAVCAAHGLGGPAGADLLPRCGLSSMVFGAGPEAVIKIFMVSEPAKAAHMAAAEAAACAALSGCGLEGVRRCSGGAADCSQPYDQRSNDQGASLLTCEHACTPAGVAPALLGMGTICCPGHDGQPLALPYLVLNKAQGAGTLRERLPQLQPPQAQRLCEALGATLARVHALPLPDAGPTGEVEALWRRRGQQQQQQQELGCSEDERLGLAAAQAVAAASVTSGTFWRSSSGQLWHSQLGCLAEKHPAAADEGPGSSRGNNQGRGSAPSTPTSSSEAGKEQQLPAFAGVGCSNPTSQAVAPAWQPFTHFLRARQARLLAAVAAAAGDYDHHLPHCLSSTPALQAFLPTDPAALLPLAAAPVLLHGDCQPDNIVVWLGAGSNEPATQPTSSGTVPAMPSSAPACATAAPDLSPSSQLGVVLLDFADSGHGDPLWDLIPLWGSLERSAALLAACARGHGAEALLLRHQRAEGLLPSYVLMCYLLMHEQGEPLISKALRPTRSTAVAAAGGGAATTAAVAPAPSLPELQKRWFGWADAL